MTELEEWKQAASVEAGLRREFLVRAEMAEEENERLRACILDAWALIDNELVGPWAAKWKDLLE